MIYFWLFFAWWVLSILKDLIQYYVWFHEIYPEYSYIKNVLYHRKFHLKLDSDSEVFLVKLLESYDIQIKDSEYYIITDTMTLRVEVLKRILILHHEDLNAIVMSTGNISFETINCIKAAQKKLTHGIKY